MWIKITKPFEWRPNERQIYVYQVGNRYSVTHTCGQIAIKSGCAVEIPSPDKKTQQEWASKSQF